MGVLVNNQWSVGGAPGRPSVNFFTAQYFFNYNFPGGHGWYFTTHLSPRIGRLHLASNGPFLLAAASAACSKSAISRLVR